MVYLHANLFLPYTINFGPQTPKSRGSPSRDPVNQNAASQARPQNLPGNITPPKTPANASTPFGPHIDIASPALHFTRPQPQRVLSRIDVHAPEWGHERVFNQPRSKARAAPPSNILEYTRAQEELAVSELHKRSAHQPKGITQTAPGFDTPARTPSREKSPKASDWSVEPAIHGNGALSNAVRAVKERGLLKDDLHYFGTLGFPTDGLSNLKRDKISDHLDAEYDAHAVYVEDESFDRHYTHYCKRILWPIFNYQVPDQPKSKAYADHSWKYYVQVNEAIADKIVQYYKHGDCIWIHDYHLLLVPGMIRKQLPAARIGFFLHTAFPSSEIFRCLAMSRDLLRGMLGANLVVFQSSEYAQHFLQTCSRLLVVEATDSNVQIDDRFVNVSTVPIGIIPEDLLNARKDPEVVRWTHTLLEKYQGKRLIASRDTLDGMRGIKQKLLAYESFLEQNPEWVDHVVLIQVATSAVGENQDLHAAVSEIITRIEARFSTLIHSPIVFLRQEIAFTHYLGLLTAADIMLVTPLRDGMNLTCHDFIECQDGQVTNQKRHGPLVLSEFAGSAEIFKDNQFTVNPWDSHQMARAIKRALEITPAERDRHYSALSSIVKYNNGVRWFEELEKRLALAYEAQQQRESHNVPRLPVNNLIRKYKASSKRLFVLDYEGTLINWDPPQQTLLSSPDRVIDTMFDLCLASYDNIIYITSNRTQSELENVFKQVPNIGLVAENGCFIRPFAQKEWVDLAGSTRRDSQEWREGIMAHLSYYQERIEGSWIEERGCIMVFHYEDAKDLESASRQAGEMAHQLNESCGSQQMKAVPLEKTVVIEPRGVDKRTTCEWILDDIIQPQGLRCRSLTATSSATEDYFTGSPPLMCLDKPGNHSRTSSTDHLTPSIQRIDDSESTPLGSEPAVGTTTNLHASWPDQASDVESLKDLTLQADQPDFVMVAGNDREDESMFQWANELAEGDINKSGNGKSTDVFSVCIGNHNTEAAYTLTQGATGLLSALGRMAEL